MIVVFICIFETLNHTNFKYLYFRILLLHNSQSKGQGFAGHGGPRNVSDFCIATYVYAST